MFGLGFCSAWSLFVWVFVEPMVEIPFALWLYVGTRLPSSVLMLLVSFVSFLFLNVLDSVLELRFTLWLHDGTLLSNLVLLS